MLRWLGLGLVLLLLVVPLLAALWRLLGLPMEGEEVGAAFFIACFATLILVIGPVNHLLMMRTVRRLVIEALETQAHEPDES